jgi:hypothetical protein
MIRTLVFATAALAMAGAAAAAPPAATTDKPAATSTSTSTAKSTTDAAKPMKAGHKAKAKVDCTKPENKDKAACKAAKPS